MGGISEQLERCHLHLTRLCLQRSGPKWKQWRKSNASKLLLGVLRAAIESLASAPDWMPAEASDDIRGIKVHMVSVSHSAMRLIGSMPIVFWPALLEWLREQRGALALWRAL